MACRKRTIADLLGMSGFLEFLRVEEERGAWREIAWFLGRETEAVAELASPVELKAIEALQDRLAIALEFERANGAGALLAADHPINREFSELGLEWIRLPKSGERAIAA